MTSVHHVDMRLPMIMPVTARVMLASAWYRQRSAGLWRLRRVPRAGWAAHQA